MPEKHGFRPIILQYPLRYFSQIVEKTCDIFLRLHSGKKSLRSTFLPDVPHRTSTAGFWSSNFLLISLLCSLFSSAWSKLAVNSSMASKNSSSDSGESRMWCGICCVLPVWLKIRELGFDCAIVVDFCGLLLWISIGEFAVFARRCPLPINWKNKVEFPVKIIVCHDFAPNLHWIWPYLSEFWKFCVYIANLFSGGVRAYTCYVNISEIESSWKFRNFFHSCRSINSANFVIEMSKWLNINRPVCSSVNVWVIVGFQKKSRKCRIHVTITCFFGTLSNLIGWNTICHLCFPGEGFF